MLSVNRMRLSKIIRDRCVRHHRNELKIERVRNPVSPANCFPRFLVGWNVILKKLQVTFLKGEGFFLEAQNRRWKSPVKQAIKAFRLTPSVSAFGKPKYQSNQTWYRTIWTIHWTITAAFNKASKPQFLISLKRINQWGWTRSLNAGKDEEIKAAVEKDIPKQPEDARFQRPSECSIQGKFL